MNEFKLIEMELPITEKEVKIQPSKSMYERMNEYLSKSPTTMITTICALFIVLILSITIPLYFPSTTK